jgi:SAM-dependent methyltransferase
LLGSADALRTGGVLLNAETSLSTLATETVPLCNLCGRQGNSDRRWARLLALPARYGVLRCRGCALRWLSPRPAPDALHVVYSAEHYFGGGDTGYAQFAAQRLDSFAERIRQMIAEGARSVLDYGAATGEFVEIARSLGMRAEGIEFSDAARDQAAARGLLLHAPDAEIGRFDVIHMNHVFEHVPDPLAHLKWCREHLTAHGLLWIEVPFQFDNDLDRLRRWTGKWQPHFDAFSLHHTFFYSKRSLRLLCKRSGFHVESLTQPYAPIAGSRLRRFAGSLARMRGNGDLLELRARLSPTY